MGTFISRIEGIIEGRGETRGKWLKRDLRGRDRGIVRQGAVQVMTTMGWRGLRTKKYLAAVAPLNKGQEAFTPGIGPKKQGILRAEGF